jgi:hypothetical protein
MIRVQDNATLIWIFLTTGIGTWVTRVAAANCAREERAFVRSVFPLFVAVVMERNGKVRRTRSPRCDKQSDRDTSHRALAPVRHGGEERYTIITDNAGATAVGGGKVATKTTRRMHSHTADTSLVVVVPGATSLETGTRPRPKRDDLQHLARLEWATTIGSPPCSMTIINVGRLFIDNTMVMFGRARIKIIDGCHRPVYISEADPDVFFGLAP